MPHKNIIWHPTKVTRQSRAEQNGHKSAILWFTGLSGSGKSTIAHATEERLFQMGCRTFVLDGDNVRHGLSSDLSFSAQDRTENIRRIGETAQLFVEAGTIVLTAFISPFRVDRDKVRNIVKPDDYFEIYCQCPLDLCEQRDVKGLYRRARAGEIKEFTGISSLYEEPEQPDLILQSNKLSIEECASKAISLLQQKNVISTQK